MNGSTGTRTPGPTAPARSAKMHTAAAKMIMHGTITARRPRVSMRSPPKTRTATAETEYAV